MICPALPTALWLLTSSILAPVSAELLHAEPPDAEPTPAVPVLAPVLPAGSETPVVRAKEHEFVRGGS